MEKVYAGIAANLDKHILHTALPLLQSESIEAIEWSFDALFNHKNIPEWFVEFLSVYANEQRLIGHGVFFSVFRAQWSEQQQAWLKHLKKVNDYFKFDHISEHFGFMTGDNFHNGAPLSLPLNNTTLQIGKDRLSRISQVVDCPVGLENLAFAYSLDEVKAQGQFLDKLMECINGFIILDLHNIYCQAYNFNVDVEAIINSYPLDLVREIHISGGSLEKAYSTNRQIRRDTHDDGVPDLVLQLLEVTLPKCSNLKYCMLEQLGTGLQTDPKQQRFRSDFTKMSSIISSYNKSNTSAITNTFMATASTMSKQPINSRELYQQQQYLSNLLEKEATIEGLVEKLYTGQLSQTDWNIEQWDIDMIATAHAIAQKWK